MRKLKLERTQRSLDSFSEPDTDELFEAFEKQVQPTKPKFQPSIALPYIDSEEGIDWDEVNKHLLYPCYEATKLPIGEERNRHCSNCPECQRKLAIMDAMAVPGNKWLDNNVEAKPKRGDIDWEM